MGYKVDITGSAQLGGAKTKTSYLRPKTAINLCIIVIPMFYLRRLFFVYTIFVGAHRKTTKNVFFSCGVVQKRTALTKRIVNLKVNRFYYLPTLISPLA